jgi:hypothetical protein
VLNLNFTDLLTVGVDSTLSDSFGRALEGAFGGLTTFITISIVGGIPFTICALLLGVLYYKRECQTPAQLEMVTD